MVGPLELFYDLVMVVLVAQAAHHLAGQLTWRGLGEYAAVFALVWIAWTNGTLHHELHGREDARARSTFLLQILVLVPLGALIPRAGGARGAAFAVTAGLLFAVLAGLWALAARDDRPEYRRSSHLFVTGTAAFAILLGASALLPAGPRLLSWGLLDAAYLVGYNAALLAGTPAQQAALTITNALIERFGLLIIIVLGETVTGIVDGLAHKPADARTLAVALLTVLVGFGAWWTYFDYAGHRPLRPTPTATAQWMLTHLPLTAAIAAMGAAMVSLVEHAHEPRTPAAASWLLSAGCATILCTTMIIAGALQPSPRDRTFYKPLATICAATAAACLGLGAARPTPLLLSLGLTLLLGVPWGYAVARRTNHEGV